MAIKIIKQGKLLKSPVRFVCPRCGCVFNADGEDLGVDLDESGCSVEPIVYATCPTCRRRCTAYKWELSDE